jgi:hypothetical protein
MPNTGKDSVNAERFAEETADGNHYDMVGK